MVLAGHVIDELDAIASSLAEARAEIRRWGPGVAAAVGNTLGDGSADLDNIGGRALEKEKRDLVGGGWLPGDGEGSARSHGLYKLVLRT